ncbi:MAG: GDSL-type esterase/lipase family protein [Dehalobacterium sp.]
MNLPRDNMRICIWGDSITWGARDTEKCGWANRLRLFINNKVNKVTEVYNLGICGDDTHKLMARFELECEMRQPDIIIFAIGINDSSYIYSMNNSQVSLKQFRENLNYLINKATKYTRKIAVIGLTKVDELITNPVAWNADRYYKNENIKAYDDVLQDIAESNGFLYIHMFDLLSNEDLDDGVHPNSLGHERMYERIKSKAQSLIKMAAV